MRTHRVERERGAEALLVDALQQSLGVSVRPVEDQHALTCRRTGEFREGQRSGVEGGGVTWCRDDRLHVSLVQLQFVSRVDHLHHRRIFVFHFLRRRKEASVFLPVCF